jgi:hypothetical protein
MFNRMELVLETAAVLPLVCQIALLIERLVEAGRLFGCMRQGMFLGHIVWGRLQGFQRRFERLAAKIRAGTLRAPRQRTMRAERVRAGGKSPLPRKFGWMPHMVPGAGVVAQALELLLADPQMPALMQAAPQTGRILRPLCRMLGLKPPACLRLQRRPRGRRGGLPSATHPTSSPQGGEGDAKPMTLRDLSFTYSLPGAKKPPDVLKMDAMRERRMRAVVRAWNPQKPKKRE